MELINKLSGLLKAITYTIRIIASALLFLIKILKGILLLDSR